MASREQILDTAFKEFASKGIKEVSMDDIASALKISKKTLYDNFTSKDKLAVACTETYLDQHSVKMNKLMKFMPNPLTALVFCLIEHVKFFHRMSEKYLADVRKHPILGKKIAFIADDLKEKSSKTLHEAVEQGYILRNEDVEVVLGVVREKINTVEDVKNSEDFSYKKSFNIVTTLLRGICTPMGQQVLAELKENYS